MEVHQFSSSFKFDDYKKIGNKYCNERKKTKSKQIANSKTKGPMPSSSRNNAPEPNLNAMELDQKDDVSENILRYEKNTQTEVTRKNKAIYKSVDATYVKEERAVPKDGIKFKCKLAEY